MVFAPHLGGPPVPLDRAAGWVERPIPPTQKEVFFSSFLARYVCPEPILANDRVPSASRTGEQKTVSAPGPVREAPAAMRLPIWSDR